MAVQKFPHHQRREINQFFSAQPGLKNTGFLLFKTVCSRAHSLHGKENATPSLPINLHTQNGLIFSMFFLKVKWIECRHRLARIAKVINAISNVVKLIAMLILAILLSLALFWSSSAIIPIVASIGGVFVFFGLLIEDEAAKDEKKQTPEIFVADVSISKAKGRFGWWVLMFGIAIEIVIAAWTAYDDRETRQMAAKNNPLLQPVSQVSARLLLVVEAANSTPYSTEGLKNTFINFSDGSITNPNTFQVFALGASEGRYFFAFPCAYQWSYCGRPPTQNSGLYNCIEI